MLFVKLALVYFMNKIINILIQPNVKGKSGGVVLFSFLVYVSISLALGSYLQNTISVSDEELIPIIMILLLINFVTYFLFKITFSEVPITDYVIPVIVVFGSSIYSQIK